MAPDTYSSHASNRMLDLQGIPLATFGRRAFAFVLDFLLAAFVSTLVIVAGARAGEALRLLPAETDIRLQFNYSNWYSLLTLVLYFGFVTYLGNGLTPGKWIARIRVVSTVHEKLSLWHSLERALGYGASALEFGFGFLQYFMTDNRQTTHDRIAGTIVVAFPKKST